MATKPNKVVTYLEELPLIESHKTLSKQGHVANQKHLHYHNAYGHQTWQECEPW